jgi:hypothetical protein
MTFYAFASAKTVAPKRACIEILVI